IEAGWLHEPTLDPRISRRVNLNLLRVGERHSVQHLVVEMRELPGGLRPTRIYQFDVRGRAEVGLHDCDGPTRSGWIENHLRAPGQRLNACTRRPGVQANTAPILGGEVKSTAIGCPFETLRLTVESLRAQRRVAAVDRHGP